MSAELYSLEAEDSNNAGAQPQVNLKGVKESFNDLSGRVSELGLEIAEASGTVDNLLERAQADKNVFDTFVDQINELRAINNYIANEIRHSSEIARNASGEMTSSQDTVSETIAKLNVLIEAVEEIGSQMSEMSASLENVGTITTTINNIAKQTNLLALNATIEAARAGEAGRGFSVVASEVKALAASTADATSQIEDTLGDIKSGFSLLSERSTAATVTANEVEEQASRFTAILDGSSKALTDVDSATDEITERMDVVLGVCEEILQSSDVVAGNVEYSQEKLYQVSTTMRGICDSGDALVVMSSHNGADIADKVMIDLVMNRAQQISDLFEQSVNQGRVRMDDLFDEDYQEIAGSDPVQYMTRYTQFTDQVLPEIQEAILAEYPQVAFCAGIDRNAYLPTHNKKFSHPQGSDPVWNAANSRNRRIFNDRTGSRAGENTQPVLLQTYLRDMGGGNFVVMKDVSSPVMVNGRHWGGFRIGYKL
ncbi:MAG: chemotaxis protein [Rhodomicrobium sp.]|nr:MAG: chemotaxis protein [Rhodomicrobium sp.]